MCQIRQNKPYTKSSTNNKHEILRQELQGYDKDSLEFRVHGVRYSFELGCTEFNSHFVYNNHTSVRKSPLVVRNKLENDLGLNRISDPHTPKPFQNLICSPFCKEVTWRIQNHS